MQAPAPLAAKQWHTILVNGGSFGKPLAIVSGLATAYVAYNRVSAPRSLFPILQ